MPKVLIGLHGTDPDAAARTRRSLGKVSGRELSIVELGRSGPTAFDDLARRLLEGKQEAMVFLEAGARPAPGSLERLLDRLDPAAGLGVLGPSTNRAWNEQGAFPRVVGFQGLERVGRQALERFGKEVRSLAPLHSLGDFCMVVHREVVQAVGGASADFGDGPCWEMEWNARADRAGFPGSWVCAAFVYREPLSTPRRRSEARLAERNRRLYQDLLCGRQLRGESGSNHAPSYRSHCRGDACPNFAPPGLIQIERPLLPTPEPTAKQAAESSGNGCAAASTSRSSSESRQGGGSDSESSSRTDLPLVSCLMPTADRPQHVPWAIEWFLRQDYPHRELLILDDGRESVAELVPESSRIRYLRCEPFSSLGAKRNRACEEARGEILVHWDDDDWHAPWRLTYQVGELLDRGVDACGLDRLLFYDPWQSRGWKYVYPSGSRPWVAGGTLCFRRDYWRRHPFPDRNIGEDNSFAWGVPAGRLAILDKPSFYVALVHPSNTSRKRTQGSRWKPVPAREVTELLGESAEFWRRLAEGDPTLPPSSPTFVPRVSCLMPTRDRRPFISHSLSYFFRQTVTDAELVILDDGEDPIEDLIPDDPRVRYFRLDRRHTVGEKRNLACEEARAPIVAHWDDDDWYAPERLAAQLEPLEAQTAEVTALAMRHVLALGKAAVPTGEGGRPSLSAWHCPPGLHARLHYRDLCCGTIAYPKHLWHDRPYPSINLAEDVGFLESLPTATRFLRLPEENFFVCVRHGGNTWALPKRLGRTYSRRSWEAWKAVDPSSLIPSADLQVYREMALARR